MYEDCQTVGDTQRCDASLAAIGNQQLAAWVDNAAKYVTVQEHDTHGVPKLYLARSSDVLPPLPGDVARGLKVSLRGFLQNRVIQRLISLAFSF